MPNKISDDMLQCGCGSTAWTLADAWIECRGCGLKIELHKITIHATRHGNGLRPTELSDLFSKEFKDRKHAMNVLSTLKL